MEKRKGVLVKLSSDEVKQFQRLLSNMTIENINDYPELMTRLQVADYLDVDVQTVDRHVRLGTISKVKDLSVVRFRKSDVQNAFKNYSKYQRTVKKTQIND